MGRSSPDVACTSVPRLLRRRFPTSTMKTRLLAAAFAVLTMLTSAFASPRDAQWKSVDEAAGQGLPKTAIERLDPIITGKNIGLPPLITLLALVGGLIAFGGAGVIIGPAIAAVASVIFRVLFKRKKEIAAGDAEDKPCGTDKTPPNA